MEFPTDKRDKKPSGESGKIRVLIVDNSASMGQRLTTLLRQDPEIEVVGVASDPITAQERIWTLRPDVLMFDAEMPRMDGLTFLEQLMQAVPLPVVMVSSLTEAGCEVTLRALELGAVEFMTKPKMDLRDYLKDQAQEVSLKVKAAARARLRPRSCHLPAAANHSPLRPAALTRTTDRLIVVGASTGGPEALEEFLIAMPPQAPGILIVQHMPEKFTRSFAERCDQLCRIRVKEAADGEQVLIGQALIAPGNFHLALQRSGAQYYVRVYAGEPVNRHRPSVDVLFYSAAAWAEQNAVGVILTGMGVDGVQGLLRMRQAGAHTIVQDESSCVVFGMPKEAIQLGAAEFVLPLSRIAAMALEMAE